MNRRIIIRLPSQRRMINNICCFIIAGFLCWIYSARISIADSNNYILAYREIIAGAGMSRSMEVGFSTFVKICGALGLNYYQFKLVFSICAFIILIKAIQFYTDNVAIVLLLYAIYPFLFDLVQLRNFMMFVIVFWGIHFLYEENDYRKTSIVSGKLKYIICVLVASAFHYLGLAYLIFLVGGMDRKKLVKFTAAVTIILYAAILAFPSVFRIVFSLLGETPNTYLRFGSAFFKLALLHTLTCIIISVFLWYFFQTASEEYQNKRMNVIVNVTILVITLTPLIAISNNFSRIDRNVYFFLYIFLTARSENGNILSYHKKIYTFIAFGVAIMMFVSMIALNEGYKASILDPVLNYIIGRT